MRPKATYSLWRWASERHPLPLRANMTGRRIWRGSWGTLGCSHHHVMARDLALQKAHTWWPERARAKPQSLLLTPSGL